MYKNNNTDTEISHKPGLTSTNFFSSISSDKAESKLSRLPGPIAFVHQSSVTTLKAMLHKMINRPESEYLDYVKRLKLRTWDVESLLFTHRNVKKSFSFIEDTFLNAVDKYYLKLLSPFDSNVDEGKPTSFDNLDIMTIDMIDNVVAKEDCLKRVNDQYDLPLLELAARFDSLLPTKVFVKNLPCGPEKLYDAFMQAVDLYVNDKNLKCLYLMMFEVHVLNAIEFFYKSMNMGLVARNVLPDFDVKPANKPEIQENQIRELNTSLPNETVRPGNALLHLLTIIQRKDIADAQANGLSVLDIISIEKSEHGIDEVFSCEDLQKITCVEQLFDEFLKESRLSKLIKQLIKKLKVPLMKVAISDDKFFSKDDHAALKLVATFSNLGIRWHDNEHEACEQDPLYRKMVKTIDHLIEAYESDAQIFSTLHARFSTFEKKENARIKALESRLVESENGKAKVLKTKQKIDNVVESALFQKTPYSAVINIVENVWRKLMLVMHLKHGALSAEWQTTVNVLNQLVDSTQIAHFENRDDFAAISRETLFDELYKGFNFINVDAVTADIYIKNLKEMYADILGHWDTIKQKSEKNCASEKHLNKSNKNFTVEKSNFHSVKRNTVSDDIEASYRAASENTGEVESIYSEEINRLHSGSWVDIVELGKEAYRCRLAAAVRQTATYIFIDRFGRKVAERSQHDVAQAIKLGRLKIIESEGSFEQTWKGLIKRDSVRELDLLDEVVEGF